MDSKDTSLETAEALHREGKLAEARAMYGGAISAAPGNVRALYLLSVLEMQEGKPGASEALLKRALETEAGFVPAWYALTQLLHQQERLDEAQNAYDEATRHCPDELALWQGYAVLLAGRGRHDVLARALKAVVAKWPGIPQAWHALGETLSALGDAEGARHALGRAVRLAPTLVLAHKHLSDITTYLPGDPHLAQMEELAADGAAGQQAELHYALGKAYHDLGRYEQAFWNYRWGAWLMRARFPSDIAQVWQEAEAARAQFGEALPRLDLSLGCPDEAPVFILGMPRSGTAIVKQILAAHPQIYVRDENDALFEAAKHAGTVENGRVRFDLEVLAPSRRKEAGAAYVRRLREGAPESALRVVDTTLENVRLLGLVPALLPKARIVYCRRGAMDACLALYRSCFTDGNAYAFDLQTLGEYYRIHIELVEFWKALLPGRIYEVRYEALADGFEAQARALIAHCGLPWDDACARFEPFSAGSWKPYAPWLGPLKQALGPCFEE